MTIWVTKDSFRGGTPPASFRRAFLPLAALGLILLTAGCASNSTEPPKPFPAKVIRLKGNARWKIVPDEQWHPVKVGQQLTPLMVIETGSDSRVDFVMDSLAVAPASKPKAIASALDRNGLRETEPRPKKLSDDPDAMIRIWDNTRLMICELKASPNWRKSEIENVEFDLQAGHIYGTLKKLPANSRFEVKIPLGIAKIQEASCHINVDGICKVLSGSATLDYKNLKGESATQIILSEQMFDAKTGVLSYLPQEDKTGMPMVAQ